MIFKTLLLTGCSGDIAHSIGQIARQGGIVGHLVGCDARELGSDIFDICEVVPRADSPDYFDRLIAILHRHEVDAIVPLSDMELRRFLEAGYLDAIDGRAVVAANPLAVRVGLDKFETYRFLVDHGLQAPWTRIVGKGEPFKLPCILKPRFGQGGKGVRRVEPGEAERYLDLGDDYIWQELILPDDQEYTSGVYGAANGEIRTITFRRQLQGGYTAVAEVVEVESIQKLLLAVAEALHLRGSINVQLRLSEDGPKIFEINPRFSSTVEFRNRLGFRDFIWSLLDRMNLEIEPYSPPSVGTKLHRTGMLASQSWPPKS
jgi:carbamoyl-phosphate synthase large subunit